MSVDDTISKPMIYQVLEWAERKGSDGYTLDEFQDWCKSTLDFGSFEGKEQNEDEFINRSTSRLWCVLSESSVNATRSKIDSHAQRFTLKADASFLLLEYHELQEARLSAKQAQTNATIAIGISVFAMVLSSVIAIWASYSPVSLDNKATDILKQINHDQQEAIKSLLASEQRENAKLLAEIVNVRKEIKIGNDQPVVLEVGLPAQSKPRPEQN